MLLVFLSLAVTVFAQNPDPKDSPTWFIPTREKASSEDGKTFCENQLATAQDSELHQTRTSEILIPENLPPVICIVFPYQPNNIRYGAGTKGDCVNNCCVFRPPSKNIPSPPPNPTWFETTSDCSDEGAAVTKPIILQGQDGEDKKICELVKETSAYKIVEGKILACASGCCLFFAPQENQE